MSDLDRPAILTEGIAGNLTKKIAGESRQEIQPAQMPGLPSPSVGDDDIGTESQDIDELLKELGKRPLTVKNSSSGVISGIIVSVDNEGFFVDIGRKSEAFLSKEDAIGDSTEAKLAIGEEVMVSIAGRSSDGYLKLSRVIAERPTDWTQFENAFTKGIAIAGTVNEVVKGGLAVDVGIRAFLPKSKSGAREAADLEKLIGQEIKCRITQLDVENENIILDRRVLLEEEQTTKRLALVASLKPGMTASGTIRDIRKFGAFIDLGGVDALLHVSDVSWKAIEDLSSVLTVGDSLDVKILKIEQDGKRISVGLKQLTPDPWTEIDGKIEIGEQIKGTVKKLTDFGAFVELEPGVEGLIHVSEMSWSRRARHPRDFLSLGDVVEVTVLEIKSDDHRISLGLKQALGDPWADAAKRFAPGTAVEGIVQNLATFGAFIEIEEGIEGLLHISDMVEDQHVNHPSEVVTVGQKVQVVVAGIDTQKRRLKLDMKAVKHHTDKAAFIADHKLGDIVTGRVAKLSSKRVVVELGDSIQAICFVEHDTDQTPPTVEKLSTENVSSLGAMLQSAWKGETSSENRENRRTEKVALGQIRSFKITKLNLAERTVELELM
ncbi:MAG: 30S ribosomal protein S1 [Solibacterales bacterium]|nr:30S ribosomal protein S1 [Bryobacterales bacterium]|tara:strand:- start:40529 stop:42343 length:1815 start_codon:yes stop_codon:yes gene_type:complete